jgi:hypothetical protein
MGMLDIKDKNNNNSAPFRTDSIIGLAGNGSISVAQGIIFYRYVKVPFGVSIQG